jgi:SAM-dependent methyltransferase
MNLLDVLRWPRFEWGHRALRNPKVRGTVPYDEASADEVQVALEAAGVRVTPLRVNPEAYRDYVERANYSQFTGYYALNRPSFAEKSFEHFLASQLLALRPGAVYIDVASDTSPAPEIYSNVFGVQSWRQDIGYATGIVGNRIGGDAAAMPLADGFADAMALHCSFEHFEGDSDVRFVAECARLLRTGGRVCILPLYVSTRYSIMTDPGVYGWGESPTFEPDATTYSHAGYGQRHARFYDAAHLKSRVLNGPGNLIPTIHRVTNLSEIAATSYLHFALTLEKPGA